MGKYLDSNGVAYLWSKVKGKFMDGLRISSTKYPFSTSEINILPGTGISFTVENDQPYTNWTISSTGGGNTGSAIPVDVLYNNDTGSSGPITLSKSIANYDHMRIYYGYETYARQSVDVYNPNGKQVSLFMNQSFDAQYQTIQMANAVASGTTLTLGSPAHFETNYAAGASYNYTQTSGLRVYRVEAWNDGPAGVVPTGTISMFAGATAPTGYLLCQGQAVSRTTYADLFAVIGTTYGTGNGSTTFNLPNLQGKFALGKSSSYALGSTGGAATVSLSTANLPAHTHGSKSLVGTFRAYGDTGSIGLSGDGTTSYSGIVSLDGTFDWAPGYENRRGYGVKIDATHEHTSVGSGTAHNNMPPYQTVNYIIKT